MSIQAKSQRTARTFISLQASILLIAIASCRVHAEDYGIWDATSGPSPPRQAVWSQHHASTAKEGHLRGEADKISAKGEAYLNKQIAENYRKEAELKSIRNEQATVQGYFDRRSINKQERFEKVYQRAQRRLNYAAAAPHHGRMVRLFDPVEGPLRWPKALRDSRYARQRMAIDSLLACNGAADHGVDSDFYHSVKPLLEQMEDTLRKQIRTMPAREYLSVKRFLRALDKEVRTPQVKNDSREDQLAGTGPLGPSLHTGVAD